MIALHVAGLVWASIFILAVTVIVAGAAAAAVSDWRARRRERRADVERVRELARGIFPPDSAGDNWPEWERQMRRRRARGYARSRA